MWPSSPKTATAASGDLGSAAAVLVGSAERGWNDGTRLVGGSRGCDPGFRCRVLCFVLSAALDLESCSFAPQALSPSSGERVFLNVQDDLNNFTGGNQEATHDCTAK